MNQSPSELPDKIIVDRRKSYRNSDVRNAVRRTRDRLAEQGISDPEFDLDLLRLYARTVQSGTLAMVLLVVMTGFFGMMFGFPGGILVWAALASVFYVGHGLLARRYLGQKRTAQTRRRWTLTFAAAHILLGAYWAWFAFLGCAACTGTELLMSKAIVMLIAMAASATINYNMRGSVGLEFGLPIVAFAVAENGLFNPSAMAASAGLLATLLFFSFIAIRLRRASLAALSYRSENNALVAELEMARSISEEARRRAEDANLAKSRFLASMSHELRTPLNAILGFSEIMAKEVLGPMENENYRSYANDINQSGQHLLKLINEILDLSRIEAGKQELIEEPLRLADVVEECIGLVKMKANQKTIKIDHAFEAKMPRLLADERSVRQVALNLLSNAVKFTPSGGNIQVKTGWTASGGQYISVKDNGPGIPEDEIPVVLAAFGQGSIAIKSAEQGTGLGLPIVQALMAMHDGVFKLKSKLREGTEALVVFPAERVMDELPAAPVTSASKAARRTRQPAKTQAAAVGGA
ncbi:sensor histidine kinase [Oricola sp.]|uniref:sensor histidine kinase n=1 Tax=Oricola sp. TaxID=1979950 RepID=UPI000C984A48|nr:two-component sensor histidine kinase [Ahrensia sp.]|tara:strand:- start:871 stop:2442 length:1572 start_codon:yes stop_codon:yes gene_type:complete